MPKPIAKYDSEIGHHFGKSDLERIGLFVEMDYMNGKGYVSPFINQTKNERVKGSQMYSGVPKSKCGSQDGYFEEEFGRIFEKEALSSPFRLYLQARKESEKKNISKSAFVAPGATKLHSTPGDFFGTFGGKLEAFGTQLKHKPQYKKQAPNMLTNPGRKGGPGYVNITLSKYPEHSADHYDAGRFQVLKNYEAHKKLIKDGPLYSAHCPQPYFDRNPFYEVRPGPTYVRPKEKKISSKGIQWYPSSPSKWPGGCKDGCFDKWPKHSEDKYLTEAELMRGKRSKVPTKVFYPQARDRSKQTLSIINNKLDIVINNNNWRDFQPITFPNL